MQYPEAAVHREDPDPAAHHKAEAMQAEEVALEEGTIHHQAEEVVKTILTSHRRMNGRKAPGSPPITGSGQNSKKRVTSGTPRPREWRRLLSTSVRQQTALRKTRLSLLRTLTGRKLLL